MNISTRVFIGFAAILFFSIAGFIIQYTLSQEVARNIGFVSNSEAVMRNSTNLHKSIIEMQSSVRGFLLTDNERFLEAYHLGEQNMPSLFNEQKELVKSFPNQFDRLDSIEKNHKQWIEYAANLLNAKKESYQNEEGKVKYGEAFNKRLLKGEGIKLIKSIKDKFQKFDVDEYKTRETRRSALRKSIGLANAASIGIILINALIAVIIGYIILNTVSMRISKMVYWAGEISKGNFIVIQDNSRDELTQLADSLNTMSTQLSRSFSELKEKNKDLDQFAYATSHDLKAPLRGMYNILTWIEEDLGENLPEQLTFYLNKLKGRIVRLEQLINGMLEYARIGKQIRGKEKVNIDEMLLNIIDLIVPQNFIVNIDNKIAYLTTEKVLLEQVLTNLISNAVKFQNKPGEERIDIGCHEYKEFYEFSVTDNGIGILKDYHEKIFDLFQTLREQNDPENTGIGLSIVKRIVEEKKGSIRIYSDFGEVSTFTFTWPKK